MTFSLRIQKIYSLCEGLFIWDICCDHSLIAILNLKENRFQKVYCIDKSFQSLEKTKKHLEKIKLFNHYIREDNISEKIEIQCIDGSLLNWEKVTGSVIIAGVGSHTCLKIIKSCPESKRADLTWILNPFNYLDLFRTEIKKLFSETVSLEEHTVIESSRERVIFKLSHQQCMRSRKDKALPFQYD
ncbi:MAG: tRNA (adenine(22)-N(1))-methyltransferase TrmK [Bdellovibrionaceae bacterium]|nr:tRNA (adenine(22)-N(1))-methyltransferase TrmK [Pseudobdellovibrionaceae bacterium]